MGCELGFGDGVYEESGGLRMVMRWEDYGLWVGQGIGGVCEESGGG